MFSLFFKKYLLPLSFGLLAFCLSAKVAFSALMINEFLAANDSVNQDPQGDFDDWIELYNSGTSTLSLDGLFLTDDLDEPTQWQFPDGILLEAGDYLLIWADKDTSDNPFGIHANFKLSAGGEAIGLFDSDGVTLIDSITFESQLDDVSFGRFPDGDDNWYPMATPSPGAENIAASSELVYFSKLGGTISDGFILKLSTPSNNGYIRYTLDGSIPNSGGPGANSAELPFLGSFFYDPDVGITINNSETTVVRARSYQPNFAPSPVRTESYLAMSPELAAFESNLPVVVIDTINQTLESPTWGGSGFLHADPILTFASFFDTDPDTGLSSTSAIPDHSGRSGMNIRGQSSSELPKRPYKFETWDENNEDIDVPLLGLPSESDWIFLNPYTDRTFMRTLFAMELSNVMGYYSSRTKFVEVFVNENGGQIGGPSSDDYKGVYVFMEKIKRDENRVDIEKLSPSDNSEPDISGGYIIRQDKDREGDTFYTWAGRWFYVEPSYTEITNEQKDYIQNYIQSFEAVLQSSNFSDPVNGYEKYIDVDSFIVNDFISEITKEVDTYRYSTFVTKDRNGKLQMSPQWDFNISMGNNDYRSFGLQTQHHTSGWNRDSSTSMSEYRWHKRLLEDEEYLRRYADKWFHFRESVLSDSAIEASIDSKKALVDQGAASRNFDRWDILNSYAGFYWAYPGSNFYFGGNTELPYPWNTHTYSMQVEWIKNWLTGNGTPANSQDALNYAPEYSNRLGWIDDNIQIRTGFSQPPEIYLNDSLANAGGLFDSTGLITLSSNSNNIYYTLDGSDPREVGTGSVLGTFYSVSGATTTTVIDESADCRVRIPISSSDSSGWQSLGFDDSNWTSGITGVGYESSGNDYQALINLDIASIRGINSSAYIRIPFTLSNANLATGLQLNMKYDDAFVAYINGEEVARSNNAPANLTWNSEATTYHSDASAVNYQGFFINNAISSLQNGNNVLAIHLLNAGANSSDLLCVPQLIVTQSGNGSAILVEDTTNLRVRAKSGNTWSALNEAVFTNNKVKENLRITEIMFNPANSGGEYIELKNIGPETISLYLCHFTDGIDFTFPNMFLAPGETVLVVEDESEFLDHYGSSSVSFNIAGEFENGTGLSNGGEEIVLRDAIGQEIHDFDYDDNYPVSDGIGFSICINDPLNNDLEYWDVPSNWSPSAQLGGNPNEDHGTVPLSYGTIVINEVLAHSDTVIGDWIELHNTGLSSIDIGGWFLSDDKDQLKKYQIADGTVIPANAYIVFNQRYHFGVDASDAGVIEGFGLSEHGESVFLTSGEQGSITGEYSVFENFGATINGVTVGRHRLSDTADSAFDFVQLEAPTLGASNAPALISKVIIKEIRYNAVNESDALNEYIELFNRSSETIYLYDTNNPSNTWKFTNGIEYTFPEGASIPSGGHILVTRTDPDIFRYLNNIPLSRPIYGPYTNALDNDKDTIELLIPGTPEANFVPYIVAEKISYSDGSDTSLDLWPNEPDTFEGFSLQRESYDAYPNSPFNWLGSEITPNSENESYFRFIKSNSGLHIHWMGDGDLQKTSNLSDPWINATDWTSPHSIDTSESPNLFIRYVY